MSELKVSISGIRGIWGQSLTLDVLKDYTKAFGYYILSNGGKKIFMGRDGRPTGDIIVKYCSSILNSIGLDVVYGGVVPTPTVLYVVRNNNFDGGLIITASHNPLEWNALKYVNNRGVFVNEKELNVILDFLNKELIIKKYNEIGKTVIDEEIMNSHINAILSNINIDLIKKNRFKVVLDPVNSAGSIITQRFLKELDCEVIVVNGDISGNFDRPPEPTPKNLVHLSKIVKENNADIGFAQDPDADRLVVVDENGEVLSEELTLALSIQNILNKKKGNVVVNLSTSMINDWICKKYGVNIYRTKVGEANVVDGILKYNAIIGGEGNGGVIYPEINIARDSLVGIGLILELMAETEMRISQIIKDYPQIYSIKDKLDIKNEFEYIAKKLKEYFENKNFQINEIDGIRVDSNDIWFHIRPSNTEPIIRIIGESYSNEKLQSYYNLIRNLIIN